MKNLWALFIGLWFGGGLYAIVKGPALLDLPALVGCSLVGTLIGLGSLVLVRRARARDQTDKLG